MQEGEKARDDGEPKSGLLRRKEAMRPVTSTAIKRSTFRPLSRGISTAIGRNGSTIRRLGPRDAAALSSAFLGLAASVSNCWFVILESVVAFVFAYDLLAIA